MKYIVTGREMKEYDNNTISKIGIPSLVLMERAALSVSDCINNMNGDGRILILCGIGNNGADGLAIARILSERSFQVDVFILGNIEKASLDFKHQFQLLKHYPVQVLDELEDENVFMFKYNVIIDAIFGVGLSRDITGKIREIIDIVNRISAFKISVDIPSGVSAEDGHVMGCAFKADKTVTFGFAKRGLYLFPGTEYCGEVLVADIGISPLAFMGKCPEMFTYDEIPQKILPNRKKDGNKGTFGKVMIVAGLEKMTGAAILCARAALEMGAGMVKVISSEENRGIIQTAVPELLYGCYEDVECSMQWADVIAVGPGLGKSNLAYKYLETILEKSKLPIIMDADALNLISESEELKQLVRQYENTIIMTPHMGEMSRLASVSMAEAKSNRFEVAKTLSLEYHSIIVCKDARTCVVDEYNMIYLNITGNNGMATAGSGDALTGMISALMAQINNGFEASCIGVYLHGMAGDVACEKYTEYGVTAGRLIENIKAINN